MTVTSLPGLDALSAYKKSAGLASAPGMDAPGGSDSVSFGDMLKKEIGGAVETLQHAEQVSRDSTVGKASLTDVITAVSQAEMTVQAMTTIRDKVISAYQEVIRTGV
jgi:flagellar hook-basal body complex protein FliE